MVDETRIKEIKAKMEKAMRLTGDWYQLSHQAGRMPWSNLRGQDIADLIRYENPGMDEKEVQERAWEIWKFLTGDKCKTDKDDWKFRDAVSLDALDEEGDELASG